MKRKTYDCGLEAALDLLNGKWKPLIVRALRGDPKRFGELRRELTGISEKMLIQNLKELESDSVVRRRDFKEVPPRVEYSLTPFGSTIIPALAPFCEWGSKYMNKIKKIKVPGM
ncbi:MAG TPA: helix-turn-helix domain-containing protein [Pirellulales bacterium]|jgi:DNA-binding HxlR family transcriptional regulator